MVDDCVILSAVYKNLNKVCFTQQMTSVIVSCCGLVDCQLLNFMCRYLGELRPNTSMDTASLRSFSNLRNDRTITIHCSIRLHQQTATNNAQTATVQIRLQHIVRGINSPLASLDFCCKVNTAHHSPAAASCCGEALTSRLPSAVEFCSAVMKMFDYYLMEMQSKFICVLPASI